jgi:hypothetical protein
MVKIISRKHKKSKSKSNKLNKSNKSNKLNKSNKSNKSNKIKLLKKFVGGNGEVSFDIFNNLPEQFKLKINNSVNDNLEMKMSVNEIQSIYKKQKQYQLYDFIFDNESKQLIKVWNHENNNPESITAGLPGIHIYVIKFDNNNYHIIGKITRI